MFYRHIIFYSFLCCNLVAQPALTPHTNAIKTLLQYSLWNTSQPLKLHLGCGMSHLNGYVNIDFPMSEHTIQTHSGADIFGDIINIVFPEKSVDEIRSHHVFEHFTRGTSLGMLSAWHLWLKDDGLLIIETPDFETNIKQLLNTKLSYQEKQVILRHLTGSHEASWAIHCDGWYQEKFEHTLSALGFKIENVALSCYKNLHNITITARKKAHYSPQELFKKCKLLLSESMVDNSESENTMLYVWAQAYADTLKNMITIS